MTRLLIGQIATIADFVKRLVDRCCQYFRRAKFKSCGRRVFVGPRCSIHYSKISVGNDVFIGEEVILHASVHGIVIGNKVMLGPGVMILGGDHRFDVIGQSMYDVKDKRPQDDQLVVLEDDTWIGARAIVLVPQMSLSQTSKPPSIAARS